jgi:hypothetical protein
MTEAEILQRMNGWTGSVERRALERMLAYVRTGQSSSPVYAQSMPVQRASVQSSGSPRISGSDRFTYWTQKAMECARGTSYFSYVQAISLIQESDDYNTFVAGWCDIPSKVVTVCPRMWKHQSTKRYAVFLIHEGAHAVHGADEPTAVGIENQARRELGFWFMESETSNHNDLWRQELARRG